MSKKRNNSKGKRQQRNNNQNYVEQEVVQDYQPLKRNYMIEPANKTQGTYLLAIDSNTVTFSTGPAGTGKTFVAVAKACELLETKQVERIILTRPLQDSEEDKLGILPGEIDDKFGPYIAPMIELFNQFLGRRKVENYIRCGKIMGIPLALARGHTFDNSFMICSEMQNSTPATMKLILTRIGMYSKMVVDGDIKQKDINRLSGLEDAKHRLDNLQGIGFVNFTLDEVVRSGIVKSILHRYEKD